MLHGSLLIKAQSFTGSISRSSFLPVSHKTAWTMAILFMIVLSSMAALKFLSLHSAHADLGFYMNNLNRISEGEYWRIFWGHVQPLMLPYSFVYGVLPESWAPVALLILQGAALGLPLAWILRAWGWLPGVAYAFYFPVWYNGLFDFHFDHVSIPLLVAFFIFSERERFGWAAVMAISLILIKEPFALQSAACGVYLMAAKRRWVIGALLLAGGLFYFYVATEWLIPYVSVVNTNEVYGFAYSWLGTSLSEIVLSLLSHPVDVVLNITEPGKIFYVAGILAGLAFVSVLSPLPIIVVVPVLAISLLSNNESYYGLKHHYTAGLVAPLVAAFALGMQRIRHRELRGVYWAVPTVLCIMIVGHMAYAPSPMGRLFWSAKVWSYHWPAYRISDRDRMIGAAIKTHIPASPQISVSAQNTINHWRLAHRKYYYIFPDGVLSDGLVPDGITLTIESLLRYVTEGEKKKAAITKTTADYIVLDLRHPWYFVDQGCDWFYGKCRDVKIAGDFMEAVEKSKERYETVFTQDGFYILKFLLPKTKVK